MLSYENNFAEYRYENNFAEYRYENNFAGAARCSTHEVSGKGACWTQAAGLLGAGSFLLERVHGEKT